MEPSSRLFYCALCYTQCVICSSCDYGQIYCSPDCSRSARQKSCNEAEKRYQQTPKGKSNHALRQQRYRERQSKIVTDHTCQTAPECDPYLSVKKEVGTMFLNRPSKSFICCCCHKAVSDWLHQGFLKQRRRSQSSFILFYEPPP